MQFDDEGMVHADKNIALGHNMGFLLSLLDILLLQYFHSIDAVGLISFFLNQHYLCVGTFADDWEHVEVVECELIADLHLYYRFG